MACVQPALQKSQKKARKEEKKLTLCRLTSPGGRDIIIEIFKERRLCTYTGGV